MDAAADDDGGAGDAGNAADGAVGGRYVLVNGAFLGAWSWDAVAAGLAARGAKVSVVELPAHGADTTAVADATLAAYVAKVEAAVTEAKAPVVLVGHSMAGMIISQVAEDMPDKVDKLVYVAAFVPKDGQSLQDIAASDSASHLGPALQVDAAHGTGSVPVDKLEDIFCADCAPGTIQQLQSRYRDEPLAPLASPVHVSAASWGRVAKFYVYTKEDHAVSLPAQQAMTAGVSFARTETLDTSHAPFLSKPDALVPILAGF